MTKTALKQNIRNAKENTLNLDAVAAMEAICQMPRQYISAHYIPRKNQMDVDFLGGFESIAAKIENETMFIYDELNPEMEPLEVNSLWFNWHKKDEEGIRLFVSGCDVIFLFVVP